MTSDVRRFDVKECPQCRGTRKMTIYKEYTHEEIPCITCLGEGYVAVPSPEDKPAAGLLYAALTELERTKAELREQSEINADLFRQMEAEAHRADELESKLAGVQNELALRRDEIVRLHRGLLEIDSTLRRYYALTAGDAANGMFGTLGKMIAALFNAEDNHV